MTDLGSGEQTGLANLVAELETRLTGAAQREGLPAGLGDSIPEAETYVVMVFDGLGAAQLTHPEAGSLLAANQGVIAAPFPTTTSVALSTIVTGLTPGQHGLISHLVWLEEADQVVNTLKWVNLAGKPVEHDYPSFLPRPNLWERLRGAEVEPITVQPASFAGSPLSRLLYRGARFEGTWDEDDQVEATLDLARVPGRLILTYMWQVDFAGHVSGLGSPEFAAAVRLASNVWDRLAARLPPGATLIGTADHGLIEYGQQDKLVVREDRFSLLRFAGDPRGVHVWGDRGLIEDFSGLTGGHLVEPETVYGDRLADPARLRVGDAIVLAPDGKVILPPGFDKRLHAYHGGLDPAEVEVPMLVG
jgi:hypothetical protein